MTVRDLLVIASISIVLGLLFLNALDKDSWE